MNLFEHDLSQPGYFLWMVLFMLLIIVGRYFIIAGLFHFYFYKFKKKKWINRKISSEKYPKNQFKKEMVWSSATAILFSITGVFTVLAWQKGYTHFYVKADM